MITKSNKKKTFIYDIETYPNLFAVQFKYSTTGERQTFFIWQNVDNKNEFVNQFPLLVDFLLKQVNRVVGYNSHEFDDILINYILYERERLIGADPLRICLELKELANKAIETQNQDQSEHLSTIRRYKKLKYIQSFDLMVIFNKIERISLKQMAVNLKWHTIIDLPYAHDSNLDQDQVKKVLIYLNNDVDITELVLASQSDEIKLRDNISKRYDIDVLNSCRTDIAKAVLQKYLCEELKIPANKLKKGRTFYREVLISDCIDPRVTLYTKEGKRLMEQLKKTKIDPNKLDDEKSKKKQFAFEYKSKYCAHTIGLGGIHSVNRPEIMEADEKYIYLDVDVESYYPRVIVNNKLYPAHLGHRFIPIYENKILIPRVQAKALSKKDKAYLVDADTLKIVANGTFGLTNSVYSFLYDPKVTLSTCVNGELYLIELMEMVEHFTKAIVVYSNTDGLTFRIPHAEYAAVLRLCAQWETKFDFKLEYTRYEKMVMYDVNSYLVIKTDGETKEKGFFNTKQQLTKGYKYPIISDALYKYYVKGIPIKETIMNCKDIYMFMKSQRTDIYKFDVVLKDSHGRPHILQKTNRWIVTSKNVNEGMIATRDKSTGEFTQMQKGYKVTILNDIENQPIESYCLNYDFYINQCLIIINKIKNKFVESHISNQSEQMELKFD